ncbi:phosphohexomutase domain-containing protein [Alcanivorax sediminis]|uniref:phosphomannomutase n=1 Tax=Alcanivorax sediminis TaxID=2663008 RepID=A0A6N7LWV0_9GAMM|nr:phosphomannomutase CpsG [Alcanivorax sediminis]MQX54753.1 phosphomannomutase CpsG [Alcanivorax sediminis]
MSTACFKAYDIRGKIGEELNEDMAWRIGRAMADWLKARSIVVGADMRLSSPALCNALCEGIMSSGADVVDIGLSGTEEVYFGTVFHQADGGVQITASHNPADYNGMKLVRRGASPISGDTGLFEIRDRVIENRFPDTGIRGIRHRRTDKRPYIDHLLHLVDCQPLDGFCMVSNAGNGAIGPALDVLQEALAQKGIHPLLHRYQDTPDGTFPNGVPNPLLPENRAETSQAVIRHGAQLGVAFDGDFDRCFFFDEHGDFVESYYIIGLLANALLARQPGSTIIHDPRLTWSTIDTVQKAGGHPLQSKTGHAFIKERMRKDNALYGGEMSGHHYFRDFHYCDSGILPWLHLSRLLAESGQPLSALVRERANRYPVSGEINFSVPDSGAALRSILDQYGHIALNQDDTDGVSLEFSDWRFNVRASNTEPLIRLNVETRANPELLVSKTRELSSLLRSAS